MEDHLIYKELAQAVIDGDQEKAQDYARKAIASKKNPLPYIKEGLIKGMGVVTELWRDGEYFLPDVVMSANAMKAGTTILEAKLTEDATRKANGTIVIGTIKGDIHDIGKNLVSAILRGGDFNVIDIGVDQEPVNFIRTAEEADADIIGISCILTTSIKHIELLFKKLDRKGLRSKYQIMLGGAAFNDELAQEIGADGYAPSGDDVVRIAKSLLHKEAS